MTALRKGVRLRAEHRGEDSRYLDAHLDDDRNLHIDGQDLGPQAQDLTRNTNGFILFARNTFPVSFSCWEFSPTRICWTHSNAIGRALRLLETGLRETQEF